MISWMSVYRNGGPPLRRAETWVFGYKLCLSSNENALPSSHAFHIILLRVARSDILAQNNRHSRGIRRRHKTSHDARHAIKYGKSILQGFPAIPTSFSLLLSRATKLRQ